MEVSAPRPLSTSFLLAAVLLFFLLVSSPYPLEGAGGEGAAVALPAASLDGSVVYARGSPLLAGGSRRLLQRSAPPPPAPASGPPIGPLPYTPPPPM